MPELLHQSSIALVLTNIANSKGPKGILTTKFFDYLGAERPVFCVRSDEDILENTILQANIGANYFRFDFAFAVIFHRPECTL